MTPDQAEHLHELADESQLEWHGWPPIEEVEITPKAAEAHDGPVNVAVRVGIAETLEWARRLW
jgi:hypothetical protein